MMRTVASKSGRVGELLQALAYRDFDFDLRQGLFWIGDYDPGRLADERAVSEEVEKQVEQHLLRHHGVSSEQGVEVSDDWCSNCTKQLLSNKFGPSADLVVELEEFEGFKKVATKESATALMMGLLQLLDEQHGRAMRDATAAVRAREGLIANAESLEKALTDWKQDADRVTDFYAEWLGARFQGIVDRAERLNAISIRVPAPESVQRYLIEASRCYVLGQYMACLAVSRAAIEIALGDFLERNGAKAALRKLQEEQRDGLSARIRIAEGLNKWKLKFTLETVMEVKYWAGKVLHEKDVGPEKCKELFFKARGVLRDLYS
jgi:hypothetical protein